MSQVVISDSRVAWMISEDKWAVCFIKCHLYKKCSSHFGMDCKRMGGTEIPKIQANKKAVRKGGQRNAEKLL